MLANARTMIAAEGLAALLPGVDDPQIGERIYLDIYDDVPMVALRIGLA